MQRSSCVALRNIERKRIANLPAWCTLYRHSLSLIGHEIPAKPIGHIGTQIWIAKRIFSSSASTATILGNHENYKVVSEPLTLQNGEPKPENIRQRLRSWEAANPATSDLDLARTILVNKSKSESTVLSPDEYQKVDTEEHDADEADQLIIEDGELVDFGSQRIMLAKGDLVELRKYRDSGSGLAIFVRRIDTHLIFYDMFGKLIDRSLDVLFYVPGFVEPRELDALSPFIPHSESDLQNIRWAVPSDVGSNLVKKMIEFQKKSNEFYREAASRIDCAHQLLAEKSTLRYASLQEIAEELLGEQFMENGSFTAPALYALHHCLLDNQIYFRTQRYGSHRTWGRFEISSVADQHAIDHVTKYVRSYQASLVATQRGDRLPLPKSFLNFLTTARRLIDESRASRNWTPFGTIGPMDNINKWKGSKETSTGQQFQGDDNLFIRFIFIWTGLDAIRKNSHLHSIASAILRATGKYEDKILDRVVGWTFLQEIGVIAPWENKDQFDLRLSEAELNMTESEQLGPDIVESLRTDWGSLPVYCIDQKNALEIDDGVSIEPADLPDEYWIHVHTADPAARIAPQSKIGKRAEHMIRSLYLPERKISMLPMHVVHESFSLAPNRPCLTFSARLNRHGDLLEGKITPGIIRKIAYITPTTVSSVIGEKFVMEETVLAVGDGEYRKTTIGDRSMLEEQDMTEVDKENLILLDRLSSARAAQANARGALTFRRPKYASTVNLDRKAISVNELQFASIRPQTDPNIQLRADNWDPDNPPAEALTVRNLMILAGEVAARWCHARGIPIINQVTQFHPDATDPRENFRKKVLPIIQSKKTPIGSMSTGMLMSVMQEYGKDVGRILPSTTVGPHVALGLDMFARATSPLRRYSDLLLHWQVEAALLEEKRLGRSLVGSTADNYLPFAKKQIDKLIPYFHSRERAFYSAEKDSERFWALQLLLQAWKFNATQLPSTFELTVRNLDKDHVNGDLLLLGCLRARMVYPGWIDEEDIKPGDVFEVKIIDINVFRREVRVEGLRVVKSAEAAVNLDDDSSTSTVQ